MPWAVQMCLLKAPRCLRVLRSHSQCHRLPAAADALSRFPPPRQVREWIGGIGVENMGKRLVNSKEGKVEFDKPSMPLSTLMHYGELRQTGGPQWMRAEGQCGAFGSSKPLLMSLAPTLLPACGQAAYDRQRHAELLASTPCEPTLPFPCPPPAPRQPAG